MKCFVYHNEAFGLELVGNGEPLKGSEQSEGYYNNPGES